MQDIARPDKIFLRILFLIVFFSFGIQLNAQEKPDPAELDIIPPSPSAAALGKYGDTPVSFYTGTPNINIPLYQLKFRDITLPISISYNASGIKVAEQSSQVGLGWSLNAGGVVTKSVKSLDDDNASNKYIALTNENITSDLLGLNNGGVLENEDLNLVKSILKGQQDGESDMYYYNFLGNSGKFIYTKDGFVTLEREDFKIYGGTRIVDDKGFEYIFSKQELTKPRNSIEKQEFVSSWYLSTITSPLGNQVVFNYETVDYITTPYFDQEVYRADVNDPRFDNPQTNGATDNPQLVSTPRAYNLIKEQYLKSIEFETGYIEFHYTEGREDMRPSDPTGITTYTGRSISDIYVYNKEKGVATIVDIIHSIHFNQSYFDNGNGGFESKRLKLDQVLINDKEYSFEYYRPNDIPSIYSKGQDHWGFFNGKFNAKLTPNFDPTTNTIDDSNRSPDGESVKIGLLTKINYPTRGYTEYTYEPHDYSYVGNTAVDEDVYQDQEATRIHVANPANPASNIYTSGYSKYFIVSSSDNDFKIDAQIDYVNFANASDIQIEVLKPTFETVPIMEDPITDPSQYDDYFTPDKIVDEGTPIYSFNPNNAPFQGSIILEPGVYIMKANANVNSSSAFGIITKSVFVENRKVKEAGGVRVSQIKDYDPITGKSIIRKFSYSDPTNGDLSSGVLVSEPSYLNIRKRALAECKAIGINGSCINFKSNVTDCSYIEYYDYWYEISSQSSVPLGSTHGSHIGYENVKVEYIDSNGTSKYGSTIYSYSNPKQFIDQPNHFPVTPGPNVDMFRGQLLKMTEINGNGKKIRETINQYDNDDNKFYYMVKLADAYEMTNSASILDAECTIANSTYTLSSGKSFLEQTNIIDYIYDENEIELGQFTKSIHYEYGNKDKPENENNILITKSWTFDSNGRKITTNLSYPQNYTGDNDVYDEMVDLNIISPVIEEITDIEGAIISKKRTNYQLATSPSIESIESAKGDNQYRTLLKITKYDDYGNVLETVDSKGIKISYIWGYNYTYPIAQIVNLDYNTAISYLSTSIEGLQSLNDQEIVDQITLIRNSVTNTSASVIGLTFKPLIGKSSEIDPNGYKSSYEYDDSNRLRVIKNNEEDIKSLFLYHYVTSPN